MKCETLQKQKKDTILKKPKNQCAENILRTDGRNAAILKAGADIVKANEELMRNTKIEKVLRWTTYLSLPIGIVELILNGSF